MAAPIKPARAEIIDAFMTQSPSYHSLPLAGYATSALDMAPDRPHAPVVAPAQKWTMRPIRQEAVLLIELSDEALEVVCGGQCMDLVSSTPKTR
jgi:hypothetical protein